MTLNNNKIYKSHKSSFFNMCARGLGITLMIVVFALDVLPSSFFLGWIPAAIIMYFEKNSLFVKYHATQLFFLQLFKGLFFFALSFIAIFTNQPYFTGEVGTGTFQLSLFGYLDLGILILWLIFFLLQFWNILKYKEFNISFIQKLVYKVMDADPRLTDIYKNTPIEKS